MLDDVDKRLLRQLQADPSVPLTELAERSKVKVGAAARRLEKLAAQGVLKGQHMVIDWSALGYSVEVSLRFTLDKTQSTAFDEFLAAARLIPEVVAIQTFLGVVDVRLSVVAKDMAHYQKLYRDQILVLPHISELEALMHVATIKSSDSLPI
ncbi:MAG: Lrp/AsnC family transcriptional regulator [Pseudomonadota bacterium]